MTPKANPTRLGLDIAPSHAAKILVFTVALLITFVLYQRGTRGALLIGILGATVLATVVNAIDGHHIWTDGTARPPGARG